MKEDQTKESGFLQLHHIGVVVKDVDKATGYLSSLGIGPFDFSPPPPPPKMDIRFRGKPADYKLKGSMVNAGPVKIELLQPVEGESPMSEFLAKKGEGVQHLGFAVDNIEEEVDKLVSKGVKVLMEGKWEGGGFVFFETDETGGLTIELLQL